MVSSACRAVPFFIAVFFIYMLCLGSFALAGAGTEDSFSAAEQPCLPGEGPCFLATDESGSKLFRDVWKQTDDPIKDGWDTEAFNTKADKQLKKIGELLLEPEEINADRTKSLVDNDFTTYGLRPGKVDNVFHDKNMVIRRGAPGSGGLEEGKKYSGAQGFAEALSVLAEPFKDAEDLRFKFKLFRVLKEKDSVVTRQYFAVSGMTEDGFLEQNATWDIRWHDLDGQPPTLSAVEVIDFEEVAGAKNRHGQFMDVTESVLYKNPSYAGQILHGYPEFLNSIENTLEFNVFGTPGLSVGDVNGDGLDDLYVCQEQGLPNLLLRQNEDGSATDISSWAGVDWLQSTRSSLLIDVDNDGDQDLAAAMPGAVVFAVNDGKGKFTVVDIVGVDDDPMSMAAADYDSDGDLDIYVTLYNPNRPIEKSEATVRNSDSSKFVYHDANNGPANVLLRNDLSDGKLAFSNVTQGSGLDNNNSRFSLAAAWEDYDNDGDQDLYVANDYGRDNLYRNDTSAGGKARFTDVSDQAQVEDSAGSMGIAWGDYNRDGFMDAFVSAMWSSAGNRVTFQEDFKPDSPMVKERLQKFAHGNTMLKNNGDATFEDVSKISAIEMGRWAWSSNFVDINNDGWEDLVVLNGFLTGDSKGGDL